MKQRGTAWSSARSCARNVRVCFSRPSSIACVSTDRCEHRSLWPYIPGGQQDDGLGEGQGQGQGQREGEDGREKERTEMKWARLPHPLSTRYLPGTDHVLPTPPTGENRFWATSIPDSYQSFVRVRTVWCGFPYGYGLKDLLVSPMLLPSPSSSSSSRPQDAGEAQRPE